jgi:hypothetical protein
MPNQRPELVLPDNPEKVFFQTTNLTQRTPRPWPGDALRTWLKRSSRIEEASSPSISPTLVLEPDCDQKHGLFVPLKGSSPLLWGAVCGGNIANKCGKRVDVIEAESREKKSMATLSHDEQLADWRE